MNKRTLTVLCTVCIVACAAADIHYVNVNSTNPVAPYINWETAATNINDAVNKASNGDTVLVNNGTYAVTARTLINKRLGVASVNGPEVTIVQGDGNSDRIFKIDAKNGLVTLAGFTVTGGAQSAGAGIQAEGAGPIVIAGCIVSNNVATGNGGGLDLKETGGDTTDITVRNCLVIDNGAKLGAGIRAKIDGDSNGIIRIEDCTVIGNTSTDDGGGLWCDADTGAVHVVRTVIYDNSAVDNGGGIRLRDNATLSDSLVAGNTAKRGGGADMAGSGGNVIVNVTLVGNHATDKGGGLWNALAYNSIIYDNTASSDPNLNNNTEAYNSCSPDLTGGVDGNITNAPLFVDALNGNFRLQLASPCIDTGTNGVVVSTNDLDKAERVADGDFDGTPVVDMGAYELQVIPVWVDIKPGDPGELKPINLKAKGRIPLAVLSTDEFDALTIDPSTVVFAGARHVKADWEDVDGDGDQDLMLHVLTEDIELRCGNTWATLVALTYDDMLVAGADAIRIVPPKSCGETEPETVEEE
jgi:hypothetical protein